MLVWQYHLQPLGGNGPGVFVNLCFKTRNVSKAATSSRFTTCFNTLCNRRNIGVPISRRNPEKNKSIPRARIQTIRWDIRHSNTPLQCQDTARELSVRLTNSLSITKHAQVNPGVCSLMRKPTNGVSLERKKKRKNGFSYDRDKNGERLPRRPTSLNTIHQPWDEDFSGDALLSATWCQQTPLHAHTHTQPTPPPHHPSLRPLKINF